MSLGSTPALEQADHGLRDDERDALFESLLESKSQAAGLVGRRVHDHETSSPRQVDR